MHGYENGFLRASRVDSLTEADVNAALEGRSLQQACRFLQVDISSLRAKVPNLLLPRMRTRPKALDQLSLLQRVRDLAGDSTVSWPQAATALGISPSSLVRICRKHDVEWVGRAVPRHGIRHRNGRPSKSKDPVLIEKVREFSLLGTMTRERAALKLGVSDEVVRRILKENNLRWASPNQKMWQTPNHTQSRRHADKTAPDLLTLFRHDHEQPA